MIQKWNNDGVIAGLFPAILQDSGESSSGPFPLYMNAGGSYYATLDFPDSYGYRDNTILYHPDRRGRVMLGDIVELSSATHATFEFWLTEGSLPGGAVSYVLVKAKADLSALLLIYLDQPREFNLTCPALGRDNETAPGSYSADELMHIVLVFDGTQSAQDRFKLYKNTAHVPFAKTLDPAQPAALPDTSGAGLSIGYNDGTSLNGELRLFALYNRAISFEEIEVNYSLGPTLGGLRGYDNGDGTMLLLPPVAGVFGEDDKYTVADNFFGDETNPHF